MGAREYCISNFQWKDSANRIHVLRHICKEHKAQAKNVAKPASSVYLRYLFEKENSYSDYGEASVTLNVRKSHPSSFFCAIQFPPSGYCGVQELEDGRRVAIFSVWDKGPKGGAGPQAVRIGDGFQTSRFGGEGEGCKVMGDYDWEVGEPLIFTLLWRKEEESVNQKYSSWLIENWINDTFVSIIRFHSGPSANSPVESLLSFIEDFDRRTGRRGIYHERIANFSNVKWVERGMLKEVRFSYVKTGHDAFGVDRIDSGYICTGNTNQNIDFFLSTGGTTPLKSKNEDEVIWIRDSESS